MEEAGSSTVSGFKQAMEVPKDFKDLKTWSTKYNAVNMPFPAGFISTYIHFFHTIRHVYRIVWSLASLWCRARTFCVGCTRS